MNGLPSGFYEVTVTDTNGCTFVTNTTVFVSAPLSDTLIVTDNLCFGESFGIIDATISGGTIPYVMLGRMVKRPKISTAWQMVPIP